MYADLHIHTDFSDGIFSPNEILLKSQKANLKKISITDHDNLLGSIEANELLKTNDIDLEIISGIEFSCSENSEEFHIIGLFIDYNNQEINHLISVMQKKRMDSVLKIIEFLETQDINLSFEDIRSNAKGSIGRPHIAIDLINKGFAKNVNDAFEKFLSNKILGETREPRMSLIEAIDIINDSKGLAIWAHPNLTKKNFHYNLSSLKDIGLVGVEVSSPRYGLNREKVLLDACKYLDLLVSGGSDYHGIHQGIEISKKNGITQKEFESLEGYKNNL